jgi:hypothetical protein
MYLVRLDDASEYMDDKKWKKIFDILSKYSIKPIIGVIPNNEEYLEVILPELKKFQQTRLDIKL